MPTGRTIRTQKRPRGHRHRRRRHQARRPRRPPLLVLVPPQTQPLAQAQVATLRQRQPLRILLLPPLLARRTRTTVKAVV